jgi:hypothetical protein
MLAAASSASAGTVGAHRMSEHFAGPTLDATFWYTGQTEGTGVALRQANGQLVVTISARATPGDALHQFTTNVNTRCWAHGDFTATVHYRLNVWPTFDGVSVDMQPATLGAGVDRGNSPGGEVDFGWIDAAGAGVLATEDDRGVLQPGYA